MARTGEPFPADSEVGVKAVREFDEIFRKR